MTYVRGQIPLQDPKKALAAVYEELGRIEQAIKALEGRVPVGTESDAKKPAPGLLRSFRAAVPGTAIGSPGLWFYGDDNVWRKL